MTETPSSNPPNTTAVAKPKPTSNVMLLSLKREIDRLSKVKLSPHGLVAIRIIRQQYSELESITDQDAMVSLAIAMQAMLLKVAKYDLGVYPNTAAQKIALTQPPMAEDLDNFEKYLAIIKRYI